MKSLRTSPLTLPIALAVALVAASGARADDWLRFRGPNGAGVSHAKTIPVEISEDDYNWKIELPGEGHSQPVIRGDKIYVTSAPADGSARIVSCHAVADGELLWKHVVESAPYHNHDQSSYASGTPCVDERGLYVAFQHPDRAFIVALDHDGDELWTKDLGPVATQHGFGGSPIVWKELVIFPLHQLAGDGPESPSFVVALDRKSGDVVWKTPRKSRRTAYGTPCLLEGAGGRTELIVTSGSCGIYSLDAATGKPLWDADVFDKRTVSSPVLAAGLVFGTCGSGGGGNYLVAVRPGGSGDVKDSHVLYKLTTSSEVPYVPTSVAVDGKLFLWSDKGIVSCVNAQTGETLWKNRAQGDYSGSPIWVDGKLYCMSRRGDLVVVGAGEEFELLSRHSFAELTRSTPAVAGGRMYLRTLKHLTSVGGESAAGAKASGSAGSAE